MREYELMYIVRPDLDDEAVTAATESVKAIIEATGGQVLKTTLWGKRRLAYEVKHLRDGYYVIVRANIDGTKIRDVERNLTIHDAVFRHLLVAAHDTTDLEALQEELANASDDALAAEPAPPDIPFVDTIEETDDEDELEFAAVGADIDEEGK